MNQIFVKLLGDQDKGRIITSPARSGDLLFVPSTDSDGLATLIQVQMQRYISATRPDVFKASLQPGSILTAITKLAVVRFSKDTPSLAAGGGWRLPSGCWRVGFHERSIPRCPLGRDGSGAKRRMRSWRTVCFGWNSMAISVKDWSCPIPSSNG